MNEVVPLGLSLWRLLTRLGEAQILLPLVAGAMLWLWLRAGQGRLALRWGLVLAVAAGLTTATKLAFMGWGWGSARWDFTGISGHGMFAAACFPMLAWVGLLGRGRLAQKLGVITGFALAALVAYSRIEVHAHSASESAAGFALGALASAWVLRLAPALRLALPLWLPAGLAVCLCLLPVSAPRSRTHDWVTQWAMQVSGRAQAYTREDLHRRARPFSADIGAGRSPGPTGPTPSRPGLR